MRPKEWTMKKPKTSTFEYKTYWPTTPTSWDRGDWSRFQNFEAGDWIVITYPEYRICGRLAGIVIDRSGVAIARLLESFTVGTDKKPEGNPFDSPDPKDCRPEGEQYIEESAIRQIQRASERWKTWPGSPP